MKIEGKFDWMESPKVKLTFVAQNDMDKRFLIDLWADKIVLSPVIHKESGELTWYSRYREQREVDY